MPPIRVVVVENYFEYRELLCEQLRVAPDLDVIGNARDGWEAIRTVGRLKPDVLTLDLDLAGVSGLDVLRMTRWHSPDTKVIIFRATTRSRSSRRPSERAQGATS